MDEKHIEFKLSDNTLTIKGKQKEEKEERQKVYYLSERRYGSFTRFLRVPDGVDEAGLLALRVAALVILGLAVYSIFSYVA